MKLLNKLKQKARELKSEAQVLMIAYKDNRTPLKVKILIGITVGYLLSPIDLIPDLIPILGILDDLIIVPALIALSIKLIPKFILDEAREKLKSNPLHYKKTNWLFAIIIIIIWMATLYLVFNQVKKFWK